MVSGVIGRFIMGNDLVLNGKIVGGVRKAAYFTQLDWVQEQCMEKLGFGPYPGTLNLEISEESLPVVEALQKEEAVKLIPPDPQFCEAKALPVSIGSVSGAIIIPAEDVKVHGKNIIEVLAPLRLKDALDLEDGDSLTLIVNRGGPSDLEE
jgi:CTP-dependent riboflavin kinase